MNLVQWLTSLMIDFGAAWVMWLLIGLSVVSLAIMLERGWFFWSLRDDLARLASELRTLLHDGNIDGARRLLAASPGVEAAIVATGLEEAGHGAQAAEEAMKGAAARERIRLERRLAYLGTLGNNAPFIGLFGTVIGVVRAFAALGTQSAAAQSASVTAPQAVMASIAEALVATAVGLAVAIPAVAMYNVFQRKVKGILANTEALTHVLIAHLVAADDGAADAEH